jgi:hypothetical protein
MALGLRPSLLLIVVAAFVMNFCLPFMNVCTQAIWQRKTPVSIQGRVFAVRRLFVVAAMPISFLSAGPVAEKVFEPLVNRGGWLRPYLDVLIGAGPGRGFALTFIVAGLITLAAQLALHLYPRLRNIESELSDVALEENVATLTATAARSNAAAVET